VSPFRLIIYVYQDVKLSGSLAGPSHERLLDHMFSPYWPESGCKIVMVMSFRLPIEKVSATKWNLMTYPFS